MTKRARNGTIDKKIQNYREIRKEMNKTCKRKKKI